MNTEKSTLNSYPHGTYDDWMRDVFEVVGGVAAIVTCAIVGGDTEAADDELRKLAPAVDELAKSFAELTKPKKPKVDHKAELAKLRAALGVPKPSVERPGGIVSSALESELADIAAQVKSGNGGASCWWLSTRLQELAQRVRDGVYEDSDLPF